MLRSSAIFCVISVVFRYVFILLLQN